MKRFKYRLLGVFLALYESAVYMLGSLILGVNGTAVGIVLHSPMTWRCMALAFQAPPSYSFFRSAKRFSDRSRALPPDFEESVMSAYSEASPMLKGLVDRLRAKDKSVTHYRFLKKFDTRAVEQSVERKDGVVPVFKPGGISSMDVCRLLSHLVNDCSEPLGTCNCLMDPRKTGAFDATGLSLHAACVPLTDEHQAAMKHRNGSRVKVGHGGTLDPGACGKASIFLPLY